MRNAIFSLQGSHSNVLNHFQDFPGHFWVNFQDFPGHFWVNFQDIFPKNVEGISNFKEMEQQSSFQIPNKPKFPENSLISRTFQDSLHDSRTFQDIFSFPGHSRTFKDFPESGNPVMSFFPNFKTWKKVKYNHKFP